MLITKTEIGLRVLKDRSVRLTPLQRAIFVMVDGRRTIDDILSATAPMGATMDDFNVLFAHGLVADAAPEPEPVQLEQEQDAAGEEANAAQADERQQPLTDQERYAQAYPIAARLSSGLGLRGFRLNLAVEGARDLAALKQVAQRIRDAVGPAKFAELDHALNHEDDSEFGEFGEFTDFDDMPDGADSSLLDEPK